MNIIYIKNDLLCYVKTLIDIKKYAVAYMISGDFIKIDFNKYIKFTNSGTPSYISILYVKNHIILIYNTNIDITEKFHIFCRKRKLKEIKSRQ